MKKGLKTILSILACGVLAGCSNTSPTNTPSADKTSSTEVKYTVGIIQLVQHDALDKATEGFEDALKEALGDSVTIDYQNAAGDTNTCSTIASTFVANEYDLIMANATPAVQAAINATSTIPVLGTSVTDYATALGQSELKDGTTGINLSGTSDGVEAQLYVDCLKELVPDAKKVSIIYCSSEPNSVVQSDNFIEAMKNTDPEVECTVYTFADSNDIQTVVQSAVADCDAIYIPTDNTAASNMTIVNNITEPAKIPTICGEEGMTKSGGLATVSISYYDIGYECGKMAVEILRDGADVSKMPIKYSSNPVGKYNKAYADAIGITIPASYTAIED